MKNRWMGKYMKFVDIHCHALYGTDDGPRTDKEMYELIDALYKDNVRYLCVTPHFHPGYFGENSKKAIDAYRSLTEYVRSKYSDMKVYLGNELRYNQGCVKWIKDHRCRPVNESSFILVDFHDNQPLSEIINGTNSILNAGYIPILAHVERYNRLRADARLIRELKENGVIIQVDAQSVVGEFGFFAKLRAKKLLSLHLVDIIATDSHDTNNRAPKMTECYKVIMEKQGKQYAQRIMHDIPLAILNNNYTGRN
ncbi:MAG: hypothetical protein E7591_00045 [Ruminococcaceae bacterium]|nr:hypothetical protein [Oscillospiraceae bacterium]